MNLQPAYIEYNNSICVPFDLAQEVGMELWRWKKVCQDAKQYGLATRPGGNGRKSLLDLKAIPEEYRHKIITRYGNPEVVYNPLERFFEIDARARYYYENEFTQLTGESLEPYQIERYTINASVLNALAKLRQFRETETRMKGYARRDLKPGLAGDCTAFNEVLKLKFGGIQHTLPAHARKLTDKLNDYLKMGYGILVDGRRKNTNAQVVTPEMLSLWFDIFGGQRHKPTHKEVWDKYQDFLDGKLQVINSETGEVYNHTAEYFKPCSDSSIYNWLGDWENRVGLFKKRSGNRKTYMDNYTPSARMLRPSVGAIISVDDYQPPFKWAEGGGNRMWFYAAQDLGSTAITAWVYGDTKEGIITEFYRQLVRSYAELGLCLPYEIECEASLNSSFTNTFLAPGAMFQKVRVIPNKPRAKRVERTIRDLRLQKASKHPAFVARPDAKDENYQQKPGKQIYLSKEEIIDFELSVIEDWNNELHPDQETYKGLTRWEVFLQHQNPKLQPINWHGILPYLGKMEPTSMKMGRVRLQYLDRVVGYENRVALGEKLINIMNEIEGKDINAYWLNSTNGDVLKAHVYSKTGRFVCEVLDDLPFHRSELDQTDQCRKNMALYFAYEKTVTEHANSIAASVNQVELIDIAPKKKGSFKIAQLSKNEDTATEATGEVIEETNPQPEYIPTANDLADRF